MPRGIELVGGGVESNGVDVTVKAPVADLRSQALVSGSTPHGVLVGKERDADGAQRCSKCRFSRDIVIEVGFPQGDGFALKFCRECMNGRKVGDPLKVSMELAE